MTWQEKVGQLETDGKFAEASRVFAFSLPNASYAQKMQFADRLFTKRAYKEALEWYEECIGTPIEEEYYYLEEVGGKEAELPVEIATKIEKGDTMYKAKRFKAAVPLYLFCAKESNYAMKKLAECYFLLKEYARARDVYRELAQDTDEGYPMFMLGECYMHEMGNEYAFEHAAYWYRYSLEHGCHYAYYPLGLAYQFGYGVETDPDRAEELFAEGTKYAIDGDACYCKLGNLAYARKEFEKAKEYYGRAAKRNNARALLNLAIGYLNRDLKGMERREALCYLAKAAALGNVRAIGLFRALKKDEIRF